MVHSPFYLDQLKSRALEAFNAQQTFIAEENSKNTSSLSSKPSTSNVDTLLPGCLVFETDPGAIHTRCTSLSTATVAEEENIKSERPGTMTTKAAIEGTPTGSSSIMSSPVKKPMHPDRIRPAASGSLGGVFGTLLTPRGSSAMITASSAMDTFVSAKSWDIARAAAGTVCLGVDRVMRQEFSHVVCIVRPPGHHVGRHGRTYDAPSSGFCLLNNVVIGAVHARLYPQIKKIAILDWDIHHGNGTEELVADDPRCFFASVHLFSNHFFPGTGPTSTSKNLVNVGLENHGTGSGSLAFRTSMEEKILPALKAFEPDFIFISAGFDGHKDDIIGGIAAIKNKNQNVPAGYVEEDYAWATKEVLRIADKCCQGRVVSVLEGGYDVRKETNALAKSVVAHVDAMVMYANGSHCAKFTTTSILPVSTTTIDSTTDQTTALEMKKELSCYMKLKHEGALQELLSTSLDDDTVIILDDSDEEEQTEDPTSKVKSCEDDIDFDELEELEESKEDDEGEEAGDEEDDFIVDEYHVEDAGEKEDQDETVAEEEVENVAEAEESYNENNGFSSHNKEEYTSCGPGYLEYIDYDDEQAMEKDPQDFEEEEEDELMEEFNVNQAESEETEEMNFQEDFVEVVSEQRHQTQE
jgi:acetoin utilization deacetylase AcuC-like enzyme